ncbi:hypothetical protein G7Y89_g12998 [Cudoniella acicularis]|uniref:Uncharacterized protein n=1 Tax=Cudoniella acicularis TaxID=354080 RepID=A0A8H4VWG1_9HELO|nr:hypothetical protein G7Y89_g12998 [Cudoniella acicularis]
MYADPTTLDSNRPLLFVDREGIGGGSNVPAAVQARTGARVLRQIKTFDISQDGQICPGKCNTHRSFDSHDDSTTFTAPLVTRKFCVEDLYPRILYTFRDVLCFVSEQSNTIETTLEKLIKWAHKVVESSVNQSTLPRVIIIKNGLEDDARGWLDEESATKKMLEHTQQLRTLDKDMLEIVEYWKNAGKKPTSLADLPNFYFSNVRAVYIPSKGNTPDDVLYKQYQQLRRRVELESEAVAERKRLEWKRQTFIN